MMTATAAKALAVLRISTGFVFLWAFLDKTFGLGYATPSATGLDQRRLPHQRLPRLGRGRPVPVRLPRHRRHLVGQLACSCSACSAIGVALIAGVAMRIAAVSGARHAGR